MSRKKPTLNSGTQKTKRTSVIIGLLSAMAVAIVGAVVTHYIGILEPDIRYTYSQLQDPLRFLDQRVDSNGDFVFLASIKVQATNIAFTSGFIDRVEFVPLAIETIPKIEIKHLDKKSIGWRKPQEIEVRALLTIQAGLIGPAAERKMVALELKSFDDRGHVIDRYDDGKFARIRFDLSGEIKRVFKVLENK
ncbi:MAG: hypothetical protein ABL950_05405 [Nitrospira sp.]